MTLQSQTPRTILPISNKFASMPVEDLSAGLRASLAILTIKDNIFSIRRSGTRTELPSDQQRRIEVIILKSANTYSKAYYKNPYQQGIEDNPICWSSDGRVPDQDVPDETRQSGSCGMCSHNILKRLPTGFQGKECADRKRIAIVPASDPINDEWGGAMLFSTPPASLGALEQYGKELKKLGIPYYAYTTIISFRPNVTGKLDFEWGRPLTDDEADIIIRMREDERISYITSEIQKEETEQIQKEETQQIARQTPPPAAKPITTDTRRVSERIATEAEPAVRAAQNARVGGFAVTSKPVQETAQQGAIGQAIARPSAAPASNRAAQIPKEEIEETVDTGVDEVDRLFGNLITE